MLLAYHIIYRPAFALVSILGYGETTDDLNYNYYLARGGLRSFLDRRLLISSSCSDARYLCESMGIQTKPDEKTMIKASIATLNTFTVVFIISFLTNVFYIFYNATKLNTEWLVEMVTIEFIFLFIYFYLIHRLLRTYWNDNPLKENVVITFFINICAILLTPRLLMFSFPSIYFLYSIMLLAYILSLPIFPLRLIVMAATRRVRFRGVV